MRDSSARHLQMNWSETELRYDSTNRKCNEPPLRFPSARTASRSLLAVWSAVLSPRKRRGGALNSLFGFQVSLFNENRSLLPSEKFPVPLSREFHRKLLKFYTAYAR
jgi:hypothetical protein